MRVLPCPPMACSSFNAPSVARTSAVKMIPRGFGVVAAATPCTAHESAKRAMLAPTQMRARRWPKASHHLGKWH